MLWQSVDFTQGRNTPQLPVIRTPFDSQCTGAPATCQGGAPRLQTQPFRSTPSQPRPKQPSPPAVPILAEGQATTRENFPLPARASLTAHRDLTFLPLCRRDKTTSLYRVCGSTTWPQTPGGSYKPLASCTGSDFKAALSSQSPHSPWHPALAPPGLCQPAAPPALFIFTHAHVPTPHL